MSAPVWEYSFRSKEEKDRRLWTSLPCPLSADKFASELADSDWRWYGEPHASTVYVWKDGEYQGKFRVEPDIEVTWTATKEDEE